MIVPCTLSRRRFVVTCSLAAATLAMRFAHSATTSATPIRVVFDPAIDVSVRFASTARPQASGCHAMTGDHYRFVQQLLCAGESGAIAGICTYADFLLLTGTMQEARYRLVGHGLHGGQGAAPGHARGAHRCHGELSDCADELRRHGGRWPEILAAHVVAPGSAKTRGGAVATAATVAATLPRYEVATVSWLLKPRSAMR